MNGLGTPDRGETPFITTDTFQTFPATNLCIKRETWNLIGGFDESLIVLEDMDLCKRMFEQGVKIHYIGSAPVLHKHRNTLKSLLQHAWNTGKGSTGFTKKYGFMNGHTTGTDLSIIAVSLTPFLLIIPQTTLILGLLGYITVTLYYLNKQRTPYTLYYPAILGLYSIFLGSGFIWSTIKQIIR